jgi:CHAD domain-containing protein
VTGETPARPVEVELKYRVQDEAAAAAYLASETLGTLVADTRVRTRKMEDRYVDTAEGAFRKAGFAVRLRRTGSRTIVSCKSLERGDASGGTHRRTELEGAADAVAGPATWPESDARALVLELAGDAPLVELVTIRQVRRKRDLRDGSTRVELSLDVVDVVAGGEVIDHFVELEAELREGDEAPLLVLDGLLAADAALEAASVSKLESALAAVGRRSTSDGDGRRQEILPGTSDDVLDSSDGLAPDTGLPLAKAPGVVADDHLAEAARKVLRFHLARMLAREAGVRDGREPRDVHAMRVATRRQRAAWRVFGASFRPKRTKRYRTGLREIAARLGGVRDLDVLLEATDLYRADLPTTEQRALEPLLASWRTHRADARVLLIRELDSDGYRRWVDDYRDFVRTEGAGALPVAAVEPHRVRDTAASRIWAAYEHVRGYEPVLRWADVETLHELRIAGKWLRYTIEFVREALGEEAEPLIARVTAMQDHLGLMNDADVSARLARTFLVEHASELSTIESAAIGRYLLSREREVARLRRTVGGPWRGVAGVGFRRSLGRVVAGL